MPPVEKVGLQAFLATSEFQQGVKTYLDGISNMNRATGSAAGKMTGELGKSGSFLSNVLSQVGSSSNLGVIGLTKLIAVMSTAVAVGNLLTKALLGIVGTLKDFIIGAVQTAARQQELDFILNVLAQRFGYTAEQAIEAKNAVIDYGIRADVASNVVSEFIRNQLDLARATELARVAQDTARLANVDSSDELARLTEGIVRQNTEILRTGRITIGSQQAYQAYAQEIGKTADQLTSAERAQAFLNAVLLEGAKNAGLYEAAMESPSKQLGSLKRDIFELTRVAGEPFLLAFSEAVSILRNTAKTMRQVIDEGGPLYDFMVNIGAAATIALQGISKLVQFGLSKLVEIVSGIPKIFGEAEGDFDALADNAFEWGANIILSLAEGIVSAVSAVINALVSVGNVITNWLAPGSPPKLLPDLPKWGASALTEYMSGWAQGDFSVFDQIAGTISKFVQSLPEKVLSERGVIPRILGTRQAIAQAINDVSEAGRVTEKIVKNVTDAVGTAEHGIQEYVRASLEMSLANERLAQAQEQLNNVTSFYDEVLSELNAALKENLNIVNERQRLANIEEALANSRLTAEERARLEAEKRDIQLRQQIRAVERARDADVSAAQDQVNAAADQARAIQEQLSAAQSLIDIQAEQNTLIQQQIDLLKRLAEQGKKGGKVKPELDIGGGGPGEDDFDTVFDDLNKAVQDRVDDLKKILKDKFGQFGDIFDPLFGEGGLFQTHFGEGGTFSTLIGRITDSEGYAKFTEGMEKLRTWFETNIPQAIDTVSGWINDVLIPALSSAWTWFSENILPILQDVVGFLIDHAPEILTFIGTFATLSKVAAILFAAFVVIPGAIAGVVATVTAAIIALTNPITLIIGAISLLAAAWVGNWGNIREITQKVLDFIRDFFKKRIDNIRKVFDVFKLAFEGKWREFGEGLRKLWDEAWTELWNRLKQGGKDLQSSVAELINNIINKFQETDWGQLGRDIIDGIVNVISGSIHVVVDAIIRLAGAVVDTFKGFFGIESPSKLMGGYAEDILGGLVKTFSDPRMVASVSDSFIGVVDNMMGNVRSSMAEGFQDLSQRGLAGQNVGGPVSNTTSIDNRRSYQVEVNPTYEQTASPATVYHDVQAALGVMGV